MATITSNSARSVRRSPLASGSVIEHVLRGALGLAAVIGAIVLVGVVGPVSLVLLPVAAVAWRGCPTCWTVGLLGTLRDRRGAGAGSGCGRACTTPARRRSAAR